MLPNAGDRLIKLVPENMNQITPEQTEKRDFNAVAILPSTTGCISTKAQSLNAFSYLNYKQ